MTPMFSLLHTTRRLPTGWVDALRAWRDRADRPLFVEYVLCVDEVDDGRLSDAILENEAARFGMVRLVVNRGRRCAVDGWNTAAAASSGQFLVTVADDWQPCEHWDTELLAALPVVEGDPDLNGRYALWVATGGDCDGRIMPFSLLTRAYYEQLGGVIFHPEFVGMFGDDDYTAQAEFDGVVVDCRQTLPVFPHSHPCYGTAEWDETYRWQQRPEAYELGRGIFRKRQTERRALMRERTGKKHQKTIAVCLPGETFSQTFVAAWTRLYTGLLLDGWAVLPLWAQCSNVYAVRQELVSMVGQAQTYSDDVDLVLWLDDDNILTIEQFRKLFENLEARPDVSSVAAWTWIDRDPAIVSAGRLTEECECVPFPADFMYAARASAAASGSRLIAPEAGTMMYHGFACVLMRRELLDLVGPRPFVPILSDKFAAGMSGEDSAFCYRAQKQGARIMIDPRVEIPHLKLRVVVGPPASLTSSPDSSGVKEQQQCVEV